MTRVMCMTSPKLSSLPLSFLRGLNWEVSGSCCDDVVGEEREVAEVTLLGDDNFSDSNGGGLEGSPEIKGEPNGLETWSWEVWNSVLQKHGLCSRCQLPQTFTAWIKFCLSRHPEQRTGEPEDLPLLREQCQCVRGEQCVRHLSS